VLAGAEIVFHDALINKEILDYCPPECVCVPVGTRGGFRVPQRQETIHRMLADAAAHYSTIVRLKGGDPCIFGRGGEELEFLTAQGIAWEVVPGISTGAGGLSLLGLPVTHRDLSSSVTFLTGSRMVSGAFEGLPLATPLSPSQTLVFYMPLRHIADIASRLMQHGMAPQTPAMCVSWLSYPQQTIVTAPLTQIGTAAATALEAPVIMVVGDVVGWWQRLQQNGVGAEQV
jgi:uroporphyrinogen III methyltransferase/synthase